MLDFRDPGHRDVGHGGDAISNDETRVNIVGHGGGDFKVEEGRDDAFQIVRCGEERPGFLQADG